MFEAPQQALQAKSVAKKTTIKQKQWWIPSKQEKREKCCSAAIINQVSTCLWMPVETTWQIDGVYGIPWRWIDVNSFSHNWEREWLARKLVWKAFHFITSSIAVKISINHVYYRFLLESILWEGRRKGPLLWKCRICSHFRQVSTRQLFLSETSWRNPVLPCKFIHSGLCEYL